MKMKTKKVKKPKRRVCQKCGSERLRLEIPPDWQAFEVCKDCGAIQEGEVE